jgi:hypothetical protein
MRIEIKDNLKEISKRLTYVQREQIPFAAAMALNDLAADVADELTKQMPNIFDRPTPFTLKTYQSMPGRFYGKRANKRSLTAIIDPTASNLGERRMSYLKYQIDGGTRLPIKKAILVPTSYAPKNKFGNLSRANRQKMTSSDGKLFSAGLREGKTPGVYKRIGKDKIQPFAFYVDQAEYKPIFPVDKIAVGVVRSKFNYRMQRALQRALASAR